jgi:hypothetical protein
MIVLTIFLNFFEFTKVGNLRQLQKSREKLKNLYT